MKLLPQKTCAVQVEVHAEQLEGSFIVQPSKTIEGMDIIGPLPRSRSGNCYVLVLCDYATRYPEAITLKSIDATHVTDEIINIFARVGVPDEILKDQGSNFTSQLLVELYRLLHPPYSHQSIPPTDGWAGRTI